MTYEQFDKICDFLEDLIGDNWNAFYNSSEAKLTIRIHSEDANDVKDSYEYESKKGECEKVSTGHWEFEHEYDGEYYFTCTNCSTEEVVPTCMGEPLYNFCPNCGADMRGEKNDK